MPLLDLLHQHRQPDEPAVVFEKTVVSGGDLEQQVKEVKGRLVNAGVEPGSKVLVTLPNSPAFLVVLLAVNECKAVFMPLNPTLVPEERRRIDEIARPDVVIAEKGSVDLLPGVRLSPTRSVPYDDDDLNDLAAIIFTSGTTGAPKGVMMTETALLVNARAVARYLGLSRRDRTLVFLPLHYTYTLSQVLSTLVAGGTIVLLRNLLYPVLAFTAIAEHRVTGFAGVPTSLNILANQAASLSRGQESLRYVLSAGGPLAPASVDRVQRAFPGVAVFNNYGCTEIGPRATTIDYSAHPDKIGSIGRAIPGVSLTLVRPDLSTAEAGETGEIVLGGPSLMKGYYRDPETTSARMSRHGFHTGDYAYADREGFLYYQGRRDDIFKSAGEKISAKEIEDVVMEHEAVAEVAVVSVPDPTLGLVPVAYAVLRPGASCTARELQAFCARRLSRHKVPRAVHFVDELHKTASGKIQKYRLKEAHL
jgi:acyl-CoA synthetase (AMP-forming)/AMP-acid ligase II